MFSSFTEGGINSTPVSSTNSRIAVILANLGKMLEYASSSLSQTPPGNTNEF